MSAKFSPQPKGSAILLSLGIILLLAGNQALAQSTAKQESSISCGIESDPEFEQALLKHIEKRFFKNIGASPEQKEKISKVLENKLNANRGRRQALKEAMAAMVKLAADPGSTDQALIDQAHKARAIKEELADQRLSTFLEVRAMLTDEQKQKLSQRLQKFTMRLRPRQQYMGCQFKPDNMSDEGRAEES